MPESGLLGYKEQYIQLAIICEIETLHFSFWQLNELWKHLCKKISVWNTCSRKGGKTKLPSEEEARLEQKNAQNEKANEIIKEIRRTVWFWNVMAHVLRALNVIIALTAIIASITVASKILGENSYYTSIAAYLAAISSAMLASFNLTQKSNNVKIAWRKLNAASWKYGLEPDSEAAKLVDSWYEGETQIGDISITKDGF